MVRKVLVLVLLGLAFWAPSVYAQSSKERGTACTVRDIDATVDQHWYGLYTQGKKTGYLHFATEKIVENGETVYRSTESSSTKLVALGAKGELKSEQTLIFEGKAPFALLRGEYSCDDGKSRRNIRLSSKGNGRYEAVVTIGKTTHVLERDIDYTLADNAAVEIWLRKDPAAGATFTLNNFDFGELRVNKSTLRMNGLKEILHDGVKVTARELQKAEKTAQTGSPATLLYCDRNGVMIRVFIASFIEIKRESEEQAKKTEYSEDLIMANMAKLDREIGNLAKVKGLTLKGRGDLYSLLPQTSLQSVTSKDGAHFVKIGRHYSAGIKGEKDAISEALEESETYPIRDLKIVELAKKVIGDAKTDQEKVNRLCKFAHEYIKYEIVYLPKIHDILERKVGDCKSYALLFNCLARSVGLPSREALGFFYMGDKIKGFGGHAWNEVLIDGHWTPIDATLGHTNLLPFYICIGQGSQGRENLARMMGKLSFELVDVELAP